MSIQIQNAKILTPFSQQDGAVLVGGDRISDVTRESKAPRGAQVIDAKGLYLVPGYIDMHVHGFGGHDVMEGTPEAIEAVSQALAHEGTTAFLPTTNTAPLGAIEAAIDATKAAQRTASGAEVCGIHLQGPFLSPRQFSGPARASLLVPAQTDWKPLISRWDGIRVMGLAPELPGALTLADAMRSKGILASMAYSDATYDQVLSAVSHGFSDVTQPFIHCSSLQEYGDLRIAGITESAMVMDELTVQVVADGKYLPLLMLQLVFRCKGAENIVLISDARATPTDNSLEGANDSTLALAVRNMVAAGISLRVALRMATVNPARRIGLENVKGRIGAGYDADLLLLDESLNVRFVMARGNIIRNDLDSL